jgi:hypothetical protein
VLPFFSLPPLRPATLRTYVCSHLPTRFMHFSVEFRALLKHPQQPCLGRNLQSAPCRCEVHVLFECSNSCCQSRQQAAIVGVHAKTEHTSGRTTRVRWLFAVFRWCSDNNNLESRDLSQISEFRRHASKLVLGHEERTSRNNWRPRGVADRFGSETLPLLKR